MIWGIPGRGKATAAVEFALAFPVLLLFLGGVLDFGMINYYSSGVEHAATAGGQYALYSGNAVTGTNVAHVVQGAATLPTAITATVTVPGNATSPANAPACGCVSGTTGNFTITGATCGATCSIDNSTAIHYMYVTATANYTPMILQLPALQSIIANTYQVSRTVRVSMP